MHQKGHPAFSLIELLIVIAIIGVIASIAIAAFSNATQDARSVMVLQQQAVLQEALNAWVSNRSSVSGAGSLSAARTEYAAASTGAAKLALVAPYLDAATAAQFGAHGTVANALQTSAMQRTGQYVTFSAWGANSYPRVELGP